MIDIQTYALRKVAKKLEEIVSQFNNDTKADYHSLAQEIIDTYNNEINLYNQPDGE